MLTRYAVFQMIMKRRLQHSQSDSSNSNKPTSLRNLSWSRTRGIRWPVWRQILTHRRQRKVLCRRISLTRSRHRWDNRSSRGVLSSWLRLYPSWKRKSRRSVLRSRSRKKRMKRWLIFSARLKHRRQNPLPIFRRRWTLKCPTWLMSSKKLPRKLTKRFRT